MGLDADGNWKPNAPGFVRMDKREIEGEGGPCSPRKRQEHSKRCPGCNMLVIIHCDDCGIQETGCLCLVLEKEGITGLDRKVMELRDKGFTLPDDINGLH